MNAHAPMADISTPGPASSARGSPIIGRVLCAVAFAAITIAITHQSWADTWNLARQDPEAGQLFLVPFAFVILILACRHAQPPTMRDRALAHWIGPAMVAIGWFGWSFGFYHNHDLYWHGGAVCMMAGAAVTVLGLPILMQYGPAFLVLVFLIPVTGMFREHISGPLQLVTAAATRLLCEAVGMTVNRLGSILQTNGHDVAIAEACNGLRMFWPLFLSSYLFAFTTPMRPWLRSIVLAASPVISVVANVLRLVPTVWVFGHCELKTAEAFHDVSGWVMLIASFFFLTGIARAIRWAMPPTNGVSPPADTTLQSPAPAPRIHSASCLLTILLLAGAASGAHATPAPDDYAAYHQRVRETAAATPLVIGTWTAHDAPLDPAVQTTLNPNVVINRQYTDSKTGWQATVQLVQVTDACNIHSAAACYPAGGWTQIRRQPRDWDIGGLLLTGTEYEFCRGGLNQSTAITIADFTLLPNGQIARDVEAAMAYAADRANRLHGGAHLQFLCDSSIPEQDREAIMEEVLGQYVPLIRVVCEMKTPSLLSH